MDLSIIIVNWNTKELLRDCLHSVFEQTCGLNFEVLVVDNGSSDGSQDMVHKEFPDVTLIKSSENLGFAKANNLGLKMAKGDHLLLLNSDTVIQENAFGNMVDFLKREARAGIVGPILLNQDNTRQLSAGHFYSLFYTFLSLFLPEKYLRYSYRNTRQVDWVSGACFLFKREILEKVGELDDKFFMYVEEMEYCYRTRKAGFHTYFFSKAKVYHLTRGSSVTGKKAAVLGIYRGLLYFYTKHFAPWQTIIYLNFFYSSMFKKEIRVLGVDDGFFTKFKSDQ